MSTTAANNPHNKPEKAFSMVRTWPSKTTLVPLGKSASVSAMRRRTSLATEPKSVSCVVALICTMG